jgi:hypothetical protein
MTPKGRPFFNLDTDPDNPNNQEANEKIAALGNSGAKKGDTRSIDPQTGRKYPKGFTPPVDIYTNQDPITDAKEAELNSSQTGIFNQTSAGKDRNTGRHLEYGDSITVNRGSGISVKGSGTRSKTEVSGGSNPQLSIKKGNLSPYANIQDPNNINPNTGYPIEYGNAIKNSPVEFNNSETKERLSDRYSVYNYYNNWASKNFTHLLDFFIDNDGIPSKPRILATDAKLSSLKEIYLGTSFTRTFDDNEDPTILGVDLRLNSQTSPLLNQNIESFIKAFGTTYNEISSRENLLYRFREQLFKFIPTDLTADASYRRAKAFYLQSVTGLDKLVEAGGPDPKYFIDYGKDVITLEFLEDVSQNMGYLSALYKTLSYSKISGKEMIPPNLLKFDIDIKITEMRNYKRNIKDPKNPKRIDSFNDRISTYYYTLYECQFIFDKMPHGDMVANSKIDVLENFKLSFTYKFATMRFLKYDGKITVLPDGTARINYFIINNLRKNLNRALPSETPVGSGYLNLIDSFPSLSNVATNALKINDNLVSTNDVGTGTIPNEQTEFNRSLQDLKNEEAQKNASYNFTPESLTDPNLPQLAQNKQFDPIEAGLKNGQVTQANNQVVTQAALLDKTLGNIKDQTGPGTNIPKENFTTINDNTQIETQNRERSFFQDYERDKLKTSQSAPGGNIPLQNFTTLNNNTGVETQGKEKSFFQSAIKDRLKKDLKNAVVNQINRTITQRARLLNDAIDEIRNKIPFAGRMSEPTNVYTSTNAFRNDIINALRNAVGSSVSSFFKKPI